MLTNGHNHQDQNHHANSRPSLFLTTIKSQTEALRHPLKESPESDPYLAVALKGSGKPIDHNTNHLLIPTSNDPVEPVSLTDIPAVPSSE
jgi:hypothetical protein